MLTIKVGFVSSNNLMTELANYRESKKAVIGLV